ncbi:MAG: restriction endonuclease subunit S [Prevotella sp.]|nr:restriction endonuclease subunit S [Prevotella sp.]
MNTKKLRQKILDLAIRGKLVPQDPNDEPASVLLERIRAEKERLIKEGKIKQSKKSAKSSDTPHYENQQVGKANEVPFEVPEGWEWCKLDDLAFYKKGPFGSSLTKSMFVPDSSDAYKVYEQKNAINKDATLGHYFIDKSKFEELKGFAVQPEDIIVSCAGTIGETYVLPHYIRDGIINQALMFIRLFDKSISDFYLLYFDFILKSEAAKESKGTAIKNIPPFDILKNFYIPIPPIEEQKRIIKNVSYWLSFIDTIDTECSEINNFISKTKSKILDLAIHGKLVPQDPNDEPAIELLKRINPKFTPCDNVEVPENWVWTTLGEIISIKSGDGIKVRENKKGKYPIYGGNGINGYYDNYNVDADTIIIGRVGFYCGSVHKTESKAWITDNAFIVSNENICYTKFLFYLLNWSQLRNTANSTAQPVISGKSIYPVCIPIPPLNEQQRIVAKIEELFAVLDEIQNNLVMKKIN